MSDQSAVRDCHTFPVNKCLLRVPVECPAAIVAMLHRETFLKIQLQGLNREHQFMVDCCTAEVLFSRFDGSVFSRTGKPVARSEEVNKDTITTPRLVRTSSGSLHLVQNECIHKGIWLNSKDSRSQNFISTDSLQLFTFSCWRIRVKTEVCACSGSSSKAMLWIKEVDDLESSCFDSGVSFPGF